MIGCKCPPVLSHVNFPYASKCRVRFYITTRWGLHLSLVVISPHCVNKEHSLHMLPGYAVILIVIRCVSANAAHSSASYTAPHSSPHTEAVSLPATKCNLLPQNRNTITQDTPYKCIFTRCGLRFSNTLLCLNLIFQILFFKYIFLDVLEFVGHTVVCSTVQSFF